MNKSKSTQKKLHQLAKKRKQREANEQAKAKEKKARLESARIIKKSSPAAIIHTIRTQPQSLRTKSIIGIPFPKTYKDIYHKPQLPPAQSIASELAWTAEVLHHDSTQINTFTKKSSLFENQLLVRKYKDAQETLDNITQELGLSHWLIASSILLAEYSRGLESNREALQAILRQTDQSPFTQLYSILSSLRAEKSLSSRSFDKEIDLFVKRNIARGANPRLIGRIRFLINFPSISRHDALITALHDAAALPAIDRFQGYIRTLQVLHATQPQTLDLSIGTSLHRSAELFEDSRISNIAILSTITRPAYQQAHQREIISLADLYTTGDYKRSAALSAELLSEHPAWLELHEIHIKSKLYLKEVPNSIFPGDSIAHQVFTALSDIIAKNERTPDAIQTLEKISRVLDHLRIGNQSHAFVLSQKPPPHPFGAFKYRGLTATVATAQLATSFAKEEDAISYLNSLRTVFPDSPSIDLYASLYSNKTPQTTNANTPLGRQQIYRAHAFLRTQQHDLAIALYSSILTAETTQPLREGALVGLFQSYVQIGQYTKCANLVADTFLEQRHLLSSLDLEELIRAYEASDTNGNISWPIVYHIVYTQEGKTRNNERLHAAYDNFLSAQAVTRPSELGNRLSEFSLQKIVFFLRHICALEVMDFSVEYESTSDLESERISVCQLLLAIDSQNAETYNQEISRLTQNGMIRKAIQHIDESKVFIDTPGIAQSLDKSFRERFERYVKFSQLGEPLRKKLELHGVNIEEASSVIVYSDNTIQQFSELFSEIKNRFISSNEHGLDSYLSVRIRHGTLSGQIRSQFERENLITRKSTANGAYDSNTYWYERVFAGLDPQIQARGDTLLREFSKQIDAIIDTVKHRWIQIKNTSSNNDGLFDFDYTEGDTTKLWAKITSLITTTNRTAKPDGFDTFLQEVFAELWARTEKSLRTIVERIQVDLRAQLTDAIDSLATHLYQLHGEIRHSPLGSAITRCRTHIQNEIETIAGWFKSADDKTAPNFSLELLVQTAVEIVRNCFPSSDFKLNATLSSTATFKGSTFACFVDIMFILLENIAKHSNPDTPNATLSISTVDGKLFIRATNNISNNTPREALSAEVRRINESVPGPHSPGAIRTEGGSGYYKLHKLVRYDLGRGHGYTILVATSDTTFSVEMEMSTENLSI